MSHSNTSGQIIMHAGQHPTALMGAIYHQQILHQQQQQHPPTAGPQPMIGGGGGQQQQATQPNQLPLATGVIPQGQPTRRERKLSRTEDNTALSTAAGGPGAPGSSYGRSTEV